MKAALAAGAVLVLAGFACHNRDTSNAPPPKREQATMDNSTATEQISNDDLRWDGTDIGLQPRIDNPATEKIVADTSIPDVALLGLLRDPRRFAIAHVILTMRSRKIESFDAQQWNGLHVTLDATGAARYDASDMEALARRWNTAK